MIREKEVTDFLKVQQPSIISRAGEGRDKSRIQEDYTRDRFTSKHVCCAINNGVRRALSTRKT